MKIPPIALPLAPDAAAGEAFSPALLAVHCEPPHPLSRRALYALLALLALLLLWAGFGRLDIVAVAAGKLVPASYLKIVQPAEAGIVREILVEEGQVVEAGQVLMRMDAVAAEADRQALDNDYHIKRLGLRRIDAQLAGRPFAREKDDPAALFNAIQAQYAANVRAYEGALAQERALLDKARHELAAAEQVKAKLDQVLPHYRAQERAFDKLAQDGFAGRILANDKARERIEREQDLRAQESVMRAAQATILQSEQKLAQLGAEYVRNLQAERVELASQYEKLAQERIKQTRRAELLALRAPQAAIVKDLATHTAGTVVAPGTILMTLVPREEHLRAEVWLSNEDVGFVRAGQPVKLKLAAFPFQKYGLLEAVVAQVSADAADGESHGAAREQARAAQAAPGLLYRTLVELKQSHLEADGHRHALAAGMQVAAEIQLGTRSVLEYLLSPVQKAFHEAGRER